MDACAVALAPPSAHRRPMTGADLHGWSALPLLGSASDDSRRWLFVATRSLARLSGVPLAGAQFTATVADYGRAWPFPDDALGGVVIDGDALARGATEDALQGMLAEARRVSGGRGTVLVVCAHRLVPRRLRAWREYGRRSAERWQRAAAAAGLQMRKTGFVRLDGERVTDMTVCRGDRPAGLASDGGADRLVLRMAALPQGEAAAIDAMVGDAAGRLGLELDVDRIAVRKIGKTAVFLSAADGRRYIMRIARSPVALARATRNFDTLEWLRGSSVPDGVRMCAPAAVVRGAQGGYAYFVETCLPGRAGPVAATTRPAGDRWEMEAV